VLVVRETSERARDPVVCEARLATPSDQDVVLHIPGVNKGFVNFFVCLLE
jgi:hypothetical protein